MHLDLWVPMAVAWFIIASIMACIFGSGLRNWAKLAFSFVIISSTVYGSADLISWFMFGVAQAQSLDPLTRAIHHGALDDVRKFLPSDASTSPNGEFALTEAALSGHVEVVKEILNRGVNANIPRGWVLRDVRVWCCQVVCINNPSCEEPAVNVMRAPRFRFASESGVARAETPLMVAALKKHTDIVRVLLQYGADVNAKSHSGKSALLYAVATTRHEFDPSGAHTDDVERERLGLLDKDGDGYRTLGHYIGKPVTEDSDYANNGSHAVSAEGQSNEAVTKLLLGHGADVNVRDDEANTLLIYAVTRPTPYATFKLLLDAGADVNASSTSGSGGQDRLDEYPNGVPQEHR